MIPFTPTASRLPDGEYRSVWPTPVPLGSGRTGPQGPSITGSSATVRRVARFHSEAAPEVS